MTSQDHGFVLHSRRYRENSRIVDFMTRNHGRISLVARISAKRGGREMGALQPFTELLIHWRGRGELQNLTSVDVVQAYQLSDLKSYCGLYCNELLLYLTAKQQPLPELCMAYQSGIEALQSDCAPAPTLRQFESALLELLGYGIDFDLDNATGEPLLEGADCYFHPDWGLTQSNPGEGAIRIAQRALAGLQARAFNQPDAGRIAKAIHGLAIQQLLEGRELKSRKLMQAYLKFKQ